MTVTYDPKHPKYFDEADLREELTRVYDLCHGCRMCFNLCPSFPTMFDLVDGHDQVVEALTPEEQDRVVDECYQCKICYVKCPYIPPHEWALDFPRLMLRAHAVRFTNKSESRRDRVADTVLSRTDEIGKVNVALSPVVNKVIGNPGSLGRKLMEKTIGIASERVLPPYAKQRFSTWFKKRTKPFLKNRQGEVAIFPTCFVEYMETGIGKDLTKVLEVNGVECSLPGGAGCCGAPALHSGDVKRFQEMAERNVKALADVVRSGKDVVVPQPTCGYVLKKDYLEYVGGDEAELVSSHTFDAAEYLWKLHKGEETSLDTEFPGEVPEQVTYHVACHYQAQNIGLKSRDVLKLTGAKITLVNKCSSIDGTWGYREKNYELARKVAQPMAEAIEKAGNEVVTGDCHLANGSILQETGKVPMHPIQLIARAYGIPEEDERWGGAAPGTDRSRDA